ncbi:MAG: hypothetical protein M1829_005228 [Trizodia sp. TS-e1964]|nr:MAG: hypothetical protein M1829_005228 [Trizodia sp. TS-e1964]
MDKGKGSNIADEATECFELFKLIRRRLHSTGSPLNDGDSHLGVSDETITDALSRFNVWTGNIGAMKRGKSSLDHRLTHADVLVEVLRLLKQLRSSLSELWAIVSGARQQLTWQTNDARLSFESFSDDAFSDDGDLDTPSEGDDDEEASSHLPSEQETESGQLYAFINEVITSLFKLSMFIRKSARGNKFAKSSAEKKYETQADILHVRDRFPFASNSPGLIERLGKANAQRRQWISYKKRHREKLGTTNIFEEGGVSSQDFHSTVESGIPPRATRDETAQSTSALNKGLTRALTDLSSTEASTFYEQLPARPDAEDHSETAYSETSYNTSRQSESGEVISYMPQPPPESENQSPFECPYCFTILTISGLNGWA